jgi:thiol-disulfide isomerase/thioredoxin
MKNGRGIIKQAVFCALLVFLLVSSVSAALRTNELAPSFSLRDSMGNDFFLSDVVGEKSKEKARGVVLSFFASWCAPCRQELPIINGMTDDLNRQGVKVVLIGLKEDFDIINGLLLELKVDKPIVLSDRYGKVAEKYQVRFLPTTFFIGGDGKVKDMIFGEISGEQAIRDSARKMFK